MTTVSLRDADAGDIDEVLGWFDSAATLRAWGGLDLPFPCTRADLSDAGRFDGLRSHVLTRSDRTVGFGQYYLRDDRIHLARLAVHTAARGAGLCGRLIDLLLSVAAERLGPRDASLFVLRENVPALRCYRRAGFEAAGYPADVPYADRCLFLIRPRSAGSSSLQPGNGRKGA